MTTWTPDISQMRLIVTITVQGFGLGFLFIPLQMVAFATLPVMLRTDGAVAVQPGAQHRRGDRRVRHLVDAGAQHPGAARRDRRVTSIRSIARCRMAAAVQQHLDPATHHGAAMLDHMINQQAQIIAYVDDYKMMIFTTLPALLLLFLMRRPRQPPRAAEPSAAME